METFVEFTKDVGPFKAGHIEPFHEGIARAYIAADQAKESDALKHIKNSVDAQFRSFEVKALELIGKASGKSPSDGPPDGTEKVHAGEYVTTQAPGKRCLGEAMMCVFAMQARDTPSEVRTWADKMLTTPHDLLDGRGNPTGRKAPYAAGRVTYKVEEGKISQTVERDGVSVTRTGTESISGGPTYGFAIKPEWSNTLFRIPIEESVLEGNAFEVPVGSALEFKWPALDQFNTPIAGQSAAYAGFQLARKGEITQRQYTDASLSMIEYKITDLTAFTTISRDLDADAYIRMDAMINQVLGQAFQWKKDYEFILGNGIGSPTGFTLSNALITVTRNTGSHIYYEDIVAMMKSLHPSCWKGSCWLANVTTLSELNAIKNAAGNYVYQPNSLIAQFMRPTIMGNPGEYNDMVFRAQGMLEGLPLFFTEKLPTLGTPNDLCLIHPKSYGVASRSGLEIGMSEHFLFDTDTLAFRFKLRNDAKPLWRAPYIQSDGGTTTGTKVSAFVALK